ncbi:MAG TPA: phosphate ABC transporter ATP-binding protein [Candidatus Binatia bacterium]|jgi:tungstate transport system ATP-binding protein|nr:phosphate ABC transporter ATP-binding protein [Candidatus Binatia bacterium]
MNDFLYEVCDVSQVYDERRVLHVDHLRIYRGEILALVGPSGAGKSTFLRLLNFLEPPHGGHITFHGVSFSAQQEMPLHLRRHVTTVFQRSLLLKRTVKSNVAFGLHLRGQRNSAQRIDMVLEQVGLDALAQQRAQTLSGGEVQRVALARAMVLQPEVLLLDEPTANLDPYNVALIEEIAKRLNEEEGTTLVLVTHNVFQARRMAHRVALLLEGRVVEVADVESFFESPQDPRTGAFVRGEMIY